MKLGVHPININPTLSAADGLALARRAEELGYASWWAADHVVLPSPKPPQVNYEPTMPVLDPLVHLASVAAVTERIELGTGVLILPQRDPLVLAKQAASLDVISGGRLRLGVGVGWLEPELAAFGVKMSERGARTDEYIDAMRALWSTETPSYEGNFVSVAGVDAYPKPLSGPPVIVGGNSPGAFRRAVSRAHGWFGNGNTIDDLREHLAGLRQAADQVERPQWLGPLDIIYMPFERTLDVSAYDGLVDQFLVHTMGLDGVDAVDKVLTETIR
ncbi:LLM class F420-dependent oxidoreductase [Fodinicola acaciae]|uniref:LLM class F420-dependent oxidoreductase n=1 Tax=Fodinicola acaciae TaxID=2681555 RepID=UPI0013D30016|nr:LLM class F420-dependent oxidoreductase [Fodinicola acaciae]